MADQPRETMEKRIVQKDDGRTLILYTFQPAGAEMPAKTRGDSAP